MYNRRIKSIFPPGSKISAGLILIVGIVSVYYGLQGDSGYLVIGIIIMLISLLMILGMKGISIDIPGKRYRLYWGVPGIKFGKWQGLPEIEKVVHEIHVEGHSYHRQGAANILSGREKYGAYLKYKDSRRRILASLNNSIKAEEDGRWLAEQLGIPFEHI